jgi:hypothetical protein
VPFDGIERSRLSLPSSRAAFIALEKSSAMVEVKGRGGFETRPYKSSPAGDKIGTRPLAATACEELS